MNYQLLELAKLYGVQTAYHDVARRRRVASEETLLAVLRAMGVPVSSAADAPQLMRFYRQKLRQSILRPVTIEWEDEPPTVSVQLPETLADGRLGAWLTYEDGHQVHLVWDMAAISYLYREYVEGVRYVIKVVPLPGPLPPGYHRLCLELAGGPVETLIIAAPVRSYAPPAGPMGRTWGVFLPLYALHSESGLGADFSGLARLMDWVHGLGGGIVATLPLLPAFLDEPFEPSPYVPVSRLLWNEFYVDVSEVPSARAVMASAEFQQELKALQAMPLVDYKRQMALKRRVLEQCASVGFQEEATRREVLRFAQQHPVAEEYARFRAVCQRRRVPWRQWPQGLREGHIAQGEYDESDWRYYLYAQWLAHQQIGALSEQARRNGSGLYLDLPLGVHPDGYDAWKHQSLFAMGASVGAPPDAFFTRGQDWGFPPLHPRRLMEEGYRYFIDYVRHHLRHAGVLRIDHVMGLHRLFWVPEGLEPAQGAYVRYPEELLYAILCLESHRHRAWLVGENLGTVPGYVNADMARHGLSRTYVAQFELSTDPRKALHPVPRGAVASFNTHDMPSFAAFWQGLDIADRRDLGLIDEDEAKKQRAWLVMARNALETFLRDKGWLSANASGPYDVLQACLAYLGASQARAVLVSLEDLWLETQPQNVPGTSTQRQNWRRKARYTLETFMQLPEVVAALRDLDRARRATGKNA